MWRKPGDPDPSPPRPQQSESQTCPFCRTEIKGREVVSIHQFQERPAEEARAAAEALAYSSDQEVGEEELGQVSRDKQELELKFPDLREEGLGAWTPRSGGGGGSWQDSRVLEARSFASPRVWFCGRLHLRPSWGLGFCLILY